MSLLLADILFQIPPHNYPIDLTVSHNPDDFDSPNGGGPHIKIATAVWTVACLIKNDFSTRTM